MDIDDFVVFRSNKESAFYNAVTAEVFELDNDDIDIPTSARLW